MPKHDATPSINPRHKRLADYWLESGNATQAAIKAGYSAKTAQTQGSQILRQPSVQQYLASRAVQLQEKTDDIQTRIHRETESLAFTNIADFISIDKDGLPHVDFSNATPEQLRAITSIKTKRTERLNGRGDVVAVDKHSGFTMADKYRGLELLAKMHGMLKTEDQRIVVDVADRLLEARRRVAQLGSPSD